MICCAGPVDYALAISVDKKSAWVGKVVSGPFVINAPNLFGGGDPTSGQGGISGTVSFEPGGPTQTANTYLMSQLDGSNTPPFRGVAGFVIEQCYVGTSSYLKPWSFRLQRIHTRQNGIAQWYDAKAEINVQGNIGTGALLLLHFDGVDGQTGTVDSSAYSNSVLLNGGLGNLATAEIKEGTASLLSGANNFFGSYMVKVPYAAGSPLDIFASTEWEIDTYINLPFTSVNPFTIFSYGDSGDSSPSSCFHVYVTGIDGLGDVTFHMEDYSNWGTTVTTSLTVPFVIGDWYHVSVVGHAGEVTFYLNDVPIFMGAGAGAWKPANYTHSGSTAICIGSFSRFSGGTNGGYIDLFSVRSGLGSLDMNPAHIIRECLTDPDWGMGYNEDDIDNATFTAAADTLFNEGFGLSLLWDDQIEIQDFITEILKHINATLFVNRRTGRFNLKLIRADYDVGMLLSLTEDDIDKVTNFKRAQWGELTTSATVSYWDTATNTTATVTVQDIALETMQDAAIDYAVTYAGITNSFLATRVAQRDLHVLGSELATCMVYTSRKAKNLNPGDVVPITWSACALNATPMRILGIAYGDGKNNSLILTVCEDVFSLDSAPIAVKAPPIAIPPIGGILPIVNQLALEAPYIVMISELTQSVADSKLATNDLAGYLMTCAARPSDSSLNYELQVAAPTTYEDIGPFEWCPLGVVNTGLGRLDTAITFTSGVDLDLVVLGSCAIWDGEIVRIDAIDPVALTATLGRGCADTVPVTHSMGSFVYFFDESIGTDNFEYVSTETVNARFLTRIGSKLLDPSNATPITVVMNQRAARPYPPANVKIGGTAYATTVSGLFTITWNHRNRALQARQIVDTTESATALADNTRYILTFKNAGGTVLVTKTDIGTGTADVTLNYTGNVTCELSTQDNTATSWQKHSFVFAYTPPGGSPTNTITATAYTPIDETPIVDGGVVT